jgi:RHS repeat-associated protein
VGLEGKTLNGMAFTLYGGRATWDKAGKGSQQSFVTGKTLGALRADYSGHVGMKVTVGAQPLTLVSLGRIYVSGNSGTHTLKVVRVSDNAVVATAGLSMAGGTHGQFKYAPLAAPVTLAANTSYYVLSTETAGGDVWYDYSGTTLTTTGAASVNNGAYGDGVNWGPAGGAGNCYVPVDFQYQAGGGEAEVRWLVADQFGTPRMAIDKSGSLAGVKRRDYLPFGEEIPADATWRTGGRGYAGAADRQKFTGYERDTETGLDYAGARYYASPQGRFTSVDPVAPNVTHLLDPQRINLYAYARNNPMVFVDPTGEMVKVTGAARDDFLQWLEGAAGVNLELDAFGNVMIVGEIPDNLTATQRALLDIIRDPYNTVEVEANPSDPNVFTDHYAGIKSTPLGNGKGIFTTSRMTVNVGNYNILTAPPQGAPLVAKPQGITLASAAAHIVFEGYFGAHKGVQRLEDDPSIHIDAIDQGENGVRAAQGLSPRNWKNDSISPLATFRGRPAVEVTIDFGSHVQHIVVEAKPAFMGRGYTMGGRILATEVKSK